jgi:hypothetical protein
MEIWRDIPEHPYYQASSLGRIRVLARKIPCIRMGKPRLLNFPEKILTIHVSNWGYGLTALGTKACGRPCTVNVHRVVYRAFHGPIPEGLVINHLNGIKTDNRINNLEACTEAENAKHAVSTGLKKTTNKGKPALTREEEETIAFFYPPSPWNLSPKDRGNVTTLAKIFDRSKKSMSGIVNRTRQRANLPQPYASNH